MIREEGFLIRELKKIRIGLIGIIKKGYIRKKRGLP